MAWTISHGAPRPGRPDGHLTYGYSLVGDWRDALLALPLPGRDLSILEPLIRRRTDCYFEVEPCRAAAIATVLRQNVRRMPRGQRELTETLAAAAERASAAGQKWRWS